MIVVVLRGSDLAGARLIQGDDASDGAGQDGSVSWLVWRALEYTIEGLSLCSQGVYLPSISGRKRDEYRRVTQSQRIGESMR